MNTVMESFEHVLFQALYEVMDTAIKAGEQTEAANHAHTAELREAA